MRKALGHQKVGLKIWKVICFFTENAAGLIIIGKRTP